VKDGRLTRTTCRSCSPRSSRSSARAGCWSITIRRDHLRRRRRVGQSQGMAGQAVAGLHSANGPRSGCRRRRGCCCWACRVAARACAPRRWPHVEHAAAAVRHGPDVRQPGRLVGGEHPPGHRVAESIAPAVLWVDEIDKAFAGSQGSANTDGGTTARVMSTFLTWLSEKQKPVFVLATANNISQLPPELLRKGRLDEIFFVDLPSAGGARPKSSTIHLRKRGSRSGQVRPGSARRSERRLQRGGDRGGGDQRLVRRVLPGNKDLETEDLLKSIRETVPLSKTMHEGISALRAWARAGPGTPRFARKTATPASRGSWKCEPHSRRRRSQSWALYWY
jgi:hypothetical protein